MVERRVSPLQVLPRGPFRAVLPACLSRSGRAAAAEPPVLRLRFGGGGGGYAEGGVLLLPALLRHVTVGAGGAGIRGIGCCQGSRWRFAISNVRSVRLAAAVRHLKGSMPSYPGKNAVHAEWLYFMNSTSRGIRFSVRQLAALAALVTNFPSRNDQGGSGARSRTQFRRSPRAASPITAEAAAEAAQISHPRKQILLLGRWRGWRILVWAATEATAARHFRHCRSVYAWIGSGGWRRRRRMGWNSTVAKVVRERVDK